MDHDNKALLLDRRFLPLFITQFCGCCIDLLFKVAFITIVIYTDIVSNSYLITSLLALLANGLFIIPSIIFGGIAGQYADKYERSRLVQIIKLSELVIIGIGCYGLYVNSLFILLFVITLTGIRATFFGPLKYAILPDHLPRGRILSANGLIEASTFIGMLIGTMIGGCYNYAPQVVTGIMVLLSFVGAVSSMYILKSNNSNPSLVINKNFMQENWNVLQYCKSKRILLLSIVGIAWFWFLGTSFLSQIPKFTETILHGSPGVMNLFSAVFSVGIGAGSLWSNRLLAGEVTSKYISLALIGMSICGLDLFFSSSAASAISENGENLQNLAQFVVVPIHWRIILDLFLFSTFGAVYVVPLYAVLQVFTPAAQRSRVIAANNILSGIFMVVSTVFLSVLFMIGLQLQHIIFVLCVLNLGVAVYVYKVAPDAEIIPTALLKRILRRIFNLFYKVEVMGLEHYHESGKRSVIIANHVSFIDPLLLACYLPEDLAFAIDSTWAQKFWVKLSFYFVKVYPISRNNPVGFKGLIQTLRSNKKIVIFPEGRVSTTGSLMKIQDGPGVLADKTNASILPIRIDGAERTSFSKLKKLIKTRWFPKITITIFPHIQLDAHKDLDAKTRRQKISQNIHDIMLDMMFETSNSDTSIFENLILAASNNGYNAKIIEDGNNVMTYRRLITSSFVIGYTISQHCTSNEIVGLMLPNAASTVVVFCSMQAYNVIPAMINFTSGPNNIIAGCSTAQIKKIYTSREFIEKAELVNLVETLSHNIEIIYLEDLKKTISITNKIFGVIASYFPTWYYTRVSRKQDPSNPAVILFTSGTEGTPKVVSLSHQNICANIKQITAKIDLNNNDIAFNALPLFHCFGLTGSLVMLDAGVKTFFYPSPLHYKEIPHLFYDINATIMFTTDTFLNMYAQHAHQYDFYSARYFFAGAEKLHATTRKLWAEKFGVRIFEGYGATECSPVITCNTPMHNSHGSVGKFLPGIKYKIEKIDGIECGGKLHISGRNVMLGYMGNDSGIRNGWYDTGDIVNVDDNGYVHILGRHKRFAKIAGEMVSLYTVEDIAKNVDSNATHAAITLNDVVEVIVLYTTSKTLDRLQLADHARRLGFSEINIPKKIIYIEELPLMSTGKIDYMHLKHNYCNVA